MESAAPGADGSGGAYAFDPSTSTIWVVHYQDSVSRIVIEPDDSS